MKPKVLAALAVVCSLAAASPAVAAPPPAEPVCVGSLCGEDLAAALNLETRVQDNFWYGQVFDVEYNTPEKVLGDIQKVHNFGDSALWTGTYLASQSYRYATAEKYLAQKPDPTTRKFWLNQKREAKSRVDEMVEKYHMLVNISRNWNHELQVSKEQAGFGGGVFNGEPGLLFRACLPDESPWLWPEAKEPDPTGMPPPYTGHRRVFGPLGWPNADSKDKFFCEDGTSRDAYAGTTFGLLTAFDLVSPDDKKMREQIRDDVITMTDFVSKYYWNTPRPHGRLSIPIGSNWQGSPCKELNAVLRFCGHDFENFAHVAFMVQVPMARLNMAQIARHVAHAAPGRSDVAKWDALWAEELATQLPVLAFSMEFDAFSPNESYYKYNLHHLTAFNLIRLEANPALREEFMRALAVMDKTTGDDINAHFETITFALSGELPRRDAGITHLGEWLDYRARVDQGIPANNSVHCDTRTEPVEPVIHCVQKDQREILLDGGQSIVIPGTGGERAARALDLPVAVRPGTDFLWQREPTQLNGGDSAHHQAPGADYLLPYWMLRYHTEVVTPDPVGMPAWPGPAHA